MTDSFTLDLQIILGTQYYTWSKVEGPANFFAANFELPMPMMQMSMTMLSGVVCNASSAPPAMG
jgi:hypothetical protein